MKKLFLLGCVVFCNSIYPTHAAFVSGVQHPFYFGLSAGYGSTTWDGLVPPSSKRNLAMAMSTPISVEEGGGVWGVVAGYQLLPFFAIETTYTHYPDARVIFDPDSLVTFDTGISILVSKTESVALLGKISMLVPCLPITAYSSFGAAEVHRRDAIKNKWLLTPTFGIGFNYDINEHFIGEFGATYVAGRGQSELNPVEDYYPFLYAVFVRLAYRM